MFIVPPVAHIHPQNKSHKNENQKRSMLLLNKTRKVEVENMDIEIRTFEIKKKMFDSNFGHRLNEEIKENVGYRKLIDYQIIPITVEEKCDENYVTKFMVVLTLKN